MHIREKFKIKKRSQELIAIFIQIIDIQLFYLHQKVKIKNKYRKISFLIYFVHKTERKSTYVLRFIEVNNII